MQDATKSITLVKVGGARLQTTQDLVSLANYIAGLRRAGQSVLVVHGGGPEISELHDQLNVPFQKKNGLRVTTPRGMTLTTMVLCGLVNKRVVAALLANRLPAFGLSGVDGGILRSNFLNQTLYGHVGTPPEVNAGLLHLLISAGQVPVIAPVSLGPDGTPINVNADDAAHAIARAMHVDSLEFISDIPGVQGHDSTVIPTVRSDELEPLIANAVVTGGMIPKLRGAAQAVNSGIGRVRIGDLTGMLHDTATVVCSATQRAGRQSR